MLNEKGMVPKDKGWGDVKPWLWEKPMFHHLCCLSPFVSSNLVNLFNASAGGWGVMAEWLREFIAGENVGKGASNSSIFPHDSILSFLFVLLMVGCSHG